MSTRDIYAGPSNQNTNGLIEPGNIIDLYNRPYTGEATGLDSKIPKGTRSSTYSASFGPDNHQVLLPTVVGGKFLTNDEALERYKKTGQHLGIFDSVDSADKYAQSLHESQQAMANQYGRNSVQGGKPIRVRLKSGHAVEFPPGTSPEDAARGAKNASLALQIPPDATLRARTVSDDARLLKEHTGRAIASILGIDYDKMADLESRGIKMAMLPFGSPSEAGQRLLDTPISTDMAEGTARAQIVDPEKFAYRRGIGFNSLFVDHNGHMIDLGDAMHSDAMKAIEPDLYKKYDDAWAAGGAAPLSDIPAPEINARGALPQAIAKNKFVRVNYAPGNIGVEMYHAPSPHQIETLTQMYETAMARQPKTLGSYDIYNGSKNIFKNGLAPADLMDHVLDFYYSK